MKKLALFPLLLVGLSACQPTQGTFTVPVGVARQVGVAASVNQDCSTLGESEVRIVEPPQHGSVQIKAGPVHTTFPDSNPRHVCNTQTVPGKQVWYVPAGGYSGPDQLAFDIIYPDGVTSHVVRQIDVR